MSVKQQRQSVSQRAIARAGWRGRFVLLAAIWGLSFLFIKVGDEALAPVQVALARMVVGTGTLLIILAIRRERLPAFGTIWLRLAGAALLLNTLPFTLFAYGETRVTSILAGIWNGTTPLLTLLVVIAVLPEEKPTRSRVAGLGIGFLGVLVVLGIWNGIGSAALLGSLACLAAACCYGLGYPYSRRVLTGRSESTLALAAGQLLCGTVELGIITPFTTHMPATMSLRVVLSMLALGALGTGVAYVLNYTLVRDVGATITSTVTYVIPLFSTIAGIVFLGEHLSWNQPIGAVVVIAGVAVSQERLRVPWPRRGVATARLEARR
jgi:drug/metabolite transporter (DMT)-like permease